MAKYKPHQNPTISTLTLIWSSVSHQNSSNGNRLYQHISCIPQAMRLLLWLPTISQAPPQAPPALLIYYCYYCTPVSNHILMVEIFSMTLSMTSSTNNSWIELTATNRSFKYCGKNKPPTNKSPPWYDTNFEKHLGKTPCGTSTHACESLLLSGFRDLSPWVTNKSS